MGCCLDWYIKGGLHECSVNHLVS